MSVAVGAAAVIDVATAALDRLRPGGESRWRPLADAARDGGRGLRAAGLLPGERVVVALDGGDGWTGVALAVVLAGGVVVPAADGLSGATATARAARATWVVTDRVALAGALAPEARILALGPARGDRRWSSVVAQGHAVADDLLPPGADDARSATAVSLLDEDGEAVHVGHEPLAAAAHALLGTIGQVAEPILVGVAPASPVGLAVHLGVPAVAATLPDVVAPSAVPASTRALRPGALVLDPAAAGALAAAVRETSASVRGAAAAMGHRRLAAAAAWQGRAASGHRTGLRRSDAALARLRRALGLERASVVVCLDAVEPAALRDLHAVGLPVRRAATVAAVPGLLAVGAARPSDLRSLGRPLPGVELRRGPAGRAEARGATVAGSGWRAVWPAATLGADGELRHRPAGAPR